MDLFEQFIDKKKCVIEEITKDEYPILIWGCGDVAEYVYSKLRTEHIDVFGIIVDVAVELGSFHGKRIFNFGDCELPTNYSLVVGHSRYDLVDNIKSLHNEIINVYCITSMTLFYNEKGYMKNHPKETKTAYDCLEDDYSKGLFISYFNALYNDDYTYCKPYINTSWNYFYNDIWHVSKYEDYVDVGAYNGDSLRIFLDESDTQFRNIYAFEPDETNFEILKKFANGISHKINCIRKGVSDADGCYSFARYGNQDSHIETTSNSNTIEVVSLDSFFSGKDVSIIKTNVIENVEVIKGAENTIRRCKPKIVVAAGVNESLIIKIPILLKKILPEYRIYLRLPTGMPQRLILLANK